MIFQIIFYCSNAQDCLVPDGEEKVFFSLNSKLIRRLWVLFFRMVNALNAQPKRLCKALQCSCGLRWLSLGVSELGKWKAACSITPPLQLAVHNDLVYQ